MSRAGLIYAAVLVVLFASHFSQATFCKSNGASAKRPLDYRFPPDVVAFARTTRGVLDGRNLLAPEEVAAVVPLVNPSVRVEMGRAWSSFALFRDANRNEEGLRRIKAQFLVTNAPSTPQSREALLESVRGGVDAIVVTTLSLARIAPLLDSSGYRWKAAYADGKEAYRGS